MEEFAWVAILNLEGKILNDFRPKACKQSAQNN